MKETVCCNGGCERQEKHVELNNAIDSIDRINELLNELIRRVHPMPESNEEKASEVAAKPVIPSLCDVLSHGRDQIMDKIEYAHNQINELTELLF